jgi:hypothetical protein
MYLLSCSAVRLLYVSVALQRSQRCEPILCRDSRGPRIACGQASRIKMYSRWLRRPWPCPCVSGDDSQVPNKLTQACMQPRVRGAMPHLLAKFNSACSAREARCMSPANKHLSDSTLQEHRSRSRCEEIRSARAQKDKGQGAHAEYSTVTISRLNKSSSSSQRSRSLVPVISSC